MVFSFNDTSRTETYTLSLHDALPIFFAAGGGAPLMQFDLVPKLAYLSAMEADAVNGSDHATDRKSTRLNSSHRCISYAVFCLKKKNLKVSKNPYNKRRHDFKSHHRLF